MIYIRSDASLHAHFRQKYTTSFSHLGIIAKPYSDTHVNQAWQLELFFLNTLGEKSIYTIVEMHNNLCQKGNSS